MKCKVTMSDLMPVIMEQLEQNGQVVFCPAGISMRPMLEHNRDKVYMKKADGRDIKKWDVILYRTTAGNYILHRVVKVTEEGFITRGDHNYFNDAFQPKDALIGIIYRFERKGKQYSVDAAGYRFCVFLWQISYIPRKGIRYIWHKMKKIS